VSTWPKTPEHIDGTEAPPAAPLLRPRPPRHSHGLPARGPEPYPMSKRMLIDAAHPEEIRVAILNGNRLEEFDVEAALKRQIKGNIYLARVTRVEPSLQAAFVEYGGNRHGFLAFNEIHPDYYRIPIGDRRAQEARDARHRELIEDARRAEGAEDEGEDLAHDGQERSGGGEELAHLVDPASDGLEEEGATGELAGAAAPAAAEVPQDSLYDRAP